MRKIDMNKRCNKSEVRDSVREFAKQMELTLQKYDKKKGVDGWMGDDLFQLAMRVGEEALELIALCHPESRATDDELIDKAADVANMAMMIADNLEYY